MEAICLYTNEIPMKQDQMIVTCRQNHAKGNYQQSFLLLDIPLIVSNSIALATDCVGA